MKWSNIYTNWSIKRQVPLCIEIAVTWPYDEKRIWRYRLVTSVVLRLPIKIRDLRSSGDFELVALLTPELAMSSWHIWCRFTFPTSCLWLVCCSPIEDLATVRTWSAVSSRSIRTWLCSHLMNSKFEVTCVHEFVRSFVIRLESVSVTVVTECATLLEFCARVSSRFSWALERLPGVASCCQVLETEKQLRAIMLQRQKARQFEQSWPSISIAMLERVALLHTAP